MNNFSCPMAICMSLLGKCRFRFSAHFLVRFFLFVCFGFFCLFVFFFLLFRAAPMAYGGFHARGKIGAVAAGLCHSHSNTESEPHLQPTPQLTAMLHP